MTLWEYLLRYLSEITEGRRQPPESIVLPDAGEEERAGSLASQVSGMGVEAFVRACAAQDGTVLPAELFEAQEAPPPARVPPEADDPDAGKHIFQVFLDCLALDDGLMRYLIQVLKDDDRPGFYRLAQITTRRDLDPREFLYWLGHREDYAENDDERACAAVMDACFDRLLREGRRDVAAALLSGDEKTFASFRCEAPELVHLPAATYEWYTRYYLDRDYPVRVLLRWNGVAFPDTL